MGMDYKYNIDMFTEEQISLLRELIDSAHDNINCDTVLNNKREAWWAEIYEEYSTDPRQFICINCRDIQEERYEYCPSCGCKMSTEWLEE